MAVMACEAEVGRLYRPTRSADSVAASYYVRADDATAKRLVARLTRKGAHIRVNEAVELNAARMALAGNAVLFVRYIRGLDPMTGERWELRDYRALPLDFRLREIQRRPGYT